MFNKMITPTGGSESVLFDSGTFKQSSSPYACSLPFEPDVFVWVEVTATNGYIANIWLNPNTISPVQSASPSVYWSTGNSNYLGRSITITWNGTNKTLTIPVTPNFDYEYVAFKYT